MVRKTLTQRMRKQDAVWWSRSGVDRYGDPSFSTGVAIKCRWEDKDQLVTNIQGEEISVNGTVVVDRVMRTGDILWLGASGSADLDNPRNNVSYNEIIMFNSTPNFRVTEDTLVAMI